MSLELCILGSGSSGNSTVVRSSSGGGGAFLIDAGFGPRVTEQRLCNTGIALSDLSAIVLTHLDSDHFNPYWLLTILKYNIRVHLARVILRDFLHMPEVRDLQSRLAKKDLPPDSLSKLIHPFDDSFEPLPGVHLTALHLPHDDAGSHAFLIDAAGYRAGFATDLGHVPPALIDFFAGADFLALESNYDPDMQLKSDRPWHLKERIMSGSGHLSNAQALAAIQAILDRTLETRGPDHLPRHIVLLHRSRQCNCPNLVKKLFTNDPRIAPVLTLAHQHERTPWLHPARPRAQQVQQLAMAWG